MPIDLSGTLRLAAAVGLAALAAACAPLDFSPAQCSGPELERRGFLDGAEGRVGGYERLVRLCAGVAARPDRATYRVGYAAGLRRYCTPENGYRLGRRGGTYGNICPVDLEPAFYAAYRRGLLLWRSHLDDDDDDDRYDWRHRRRSARDDDDDDVGNGGDGTGDGPSDRPPEDGGPPPGDGDDDGDDSDYEPGDSDSDGWDTDDDDGGSDSDDWDSDDDGGDWDDDGGDSDDDGSDYDSDSDSGNGDSDSDDDGSDCRPPDC